VRSPVQDEETVSSVHWLGLLGLVLCVPFGALTLMVGWQEGHTAIETLFYQSLQVLFYNTWRRSTQGDQANPGLVGQTVVKWRCRHWDTLLRVK